MSSGKSNITFTQQIFPQQAVIAELSQRGRRTQFAGAEKFKKIRRIKDG